MRSILAQIIIVGILLALSWNAEARGGGGHSSGRSSATHASPSPSSHSRSSFAPGTGAKSESVQVRGYTKKDGTYVAPAKRSAPDKNFKNNWSTKGNTNPATGKKGNRIEPPKKH